MKKLTANIPFNYITIRITNSRINKGLLAIPTALIYLFPESACDIYLINEEGIEETKTFTPYKSSSRECRIGGLKEFYRKYKVKDGDELVIQLLDDRKYKLIPEKRFEKVISDFERKFEESVNDKDAEEQLQIISTITNNSKEDVLKSEFVRIAKKELALRKTKIVRNLTKRESVPISLRKILRNLYCGKCQLSGFSFLMKNREPYFEVHHINPAQGNHVKNLIVVSPNIHAQFTYANVEHYFDENDWLRKVKLNQKIYPVFQIIDNLPILYEKEVYY